MIPNRRALFRTFGGALALPALESIATENLASAAAPANPSGPKRFLVAGNPFGAHPDNFFSQEVRQELRISSDAEVVGMAA